MSNQFYCEICGGLFNRPAKGNKRLFCDGCKPQAEKVYQAEYYKRKKAEKEQMRADAALGRAVRCFTEGMALFRQNPEWAFRQGYSGDIVRSETPESALRAAGLMKGEER